jgi:hypothetical protein
VSYGPALVRLPVVLVGAVFLVVTGTGCGGGGEAAEPAAPSGTSAEPTSTTAAPTTSTTEVPTTPTSHPPDTPEGQVEQAYLESWDVLLASLATADPSDLATVFGDEALRIKQDEVATLAADGHAVQGSVEHNYSVSELEGGAYGVVDQFQNHLVLVDASTRRPLEADPDEPQRQTFVLNQRGGRWIVTGVFD